MRDAFKNAGKIGSSHVHVDVHMRAIETTIRVVPTPVFTSMDGVVDYTSRQNKLTARGIATTKGSTLFYDDLVDYFPRSAGALLDHDPKLHWARYDFKRKPKPDKIDANDHLIALGYVIAPSLTVELLRGVLAGSLKQLGKSTMDGEQVTEYSGKLAPDALVRDLRIQGRVDGIPRMFNIIGVKQDLFPIHVWMDDKGIARRIQFILKQEEDVVNTFRTTVDYTFSKFGPSAPVTLPDRADCLGHKRFVDFLAEYVRASV
jgi:hypothetical protein